MALGPVYIPLCPPQIGRLNLQKTAFKNICNFFEGDCIICSSNHSPHSIRFRPIRDEAGNREKKMPRKWDKGNVAFSWMCFYPFLRVFTFANKLVDKNKTEPNKTKINQTEKRTRQESRRKKIWGNDVFWDNSSCIQKYLFYL